MYDQLQEPVEVLREGMDTQRLMDENVVASAVILAGRLQSLKMANPAFEAITFSPEVETLLAAHMTAVAN
ncbi:MAG: hypothetical protein H8E62_04625 [Planctomycetes bacterium]|nr:hypothetical protein [Planctomycetota bacterium]